MNTDQISRSPLEIFVRNFCLRSTVLAAFVAGCIGNIYAVGKRTSHKLANSASGKVPRYEYLVMLPSPYWLSAFVTQDMYHTGSSSARNGADSACG